MAIPTAFQSPRTLARLNIAAVGLALAAATAAVFSRLIDDEPGIALYTALPTLVLGALWARLLRSRRRVGRTSLRWGWLLSVPLASLNAAIALALLAGFGRSFTGGDTPLASRLLGGAFMGATFGAIVWLPALIATLVCFGAPIATAQRMARAGLAGEERGEIVVGAASALVSVIAFALAAAQVDNRPEVGLPIELLATLAMATGAIAAALAALRARRRRDFVARVEQGAVAGYRVEASPEGKVLLRVEAHGGESYRVANFEQEIFALDAQGNDAKVSPAQARG